MSTRKKWIVAAIIMLVVGALICGAVFAASGFDMKKMSITSYETRTVEISESFRNISIHTSVDDITLAPSENGKCSVVLVETENIKHDVLVEDQTLSIASKGSGNWFNFLSFSVQGPSVTVYLPAEEYAALDIDASTGDVYLPQEITFDDIKTVVTTGDIFCSSSAKSGMQLSVTTGDIKVSSVTCEGTIDTHVTTGDIRLEDVSCKDLQSDGSTGDLVMKNVTAAGEFQLKRTTGDIRMERCDAKDITVGTSTGAVTGTLLTDKVFITDTGVGDVDVPETTTGGTCKITTGTGDIRIGIAK